ncbi:hypothetical protein XELAEV_18002346mg [Xenopus laevis]|nr:hypothetical protein XELAEV_18002346mg [Xenopus laevis]
MAESTPVPPPAEPAAKAKKKQQPKKAAAKAKKPSGPSASDLLVKAVSACKERSGGSLAALKKALAAGGLDVDKNSRLKLPLKTLVTKGTLTQVKGSGASGSFKLNKKQLEGKDKPAEPKANKPPAAKKAPKSPKRPRKVSAKSPKKVKKAAAISAKSPKKPKATKAKKATKSPRLKRPPKAAKSQANKILNPRRPNPKQRLKQRRPLLRSDVAPGPRTLHQRLFSATTSSS